MAAKCFTLLCISLIIALWKENKDSLHLGKCLLSGNCHHMAAMSEFKMATTLLDMQFSIIDRCRLPCQLSLRKLLYRHFAQMTAIFNFPMRLHCRSFSVSLSIPICISTYDSSSRLLITSPSTIGVRANIHLGGSDRVLPEWRTQIVCSRPDSVGGG